MEFLLANLDASDEERKQGGVGEGEASRPKVEVLGLAK